MIKRLWEYRKIKRMDLNKVTRIKQPEQSINIQHIGENSEHTKGWHDYLQSYFKDSFPPRLKHYLKNINLLTFNHQDPQALEYLNNISPTSENFNMQKLVNDPNYLYKGVRIKKDGKS